MGEKSVINGREYTAHMNVHLPRLGAGVVVTLPGTKRFYPYVGGAWSVRQDGSVGEQLARVDDVRVPRERAGVRRFCAMLVR